MFSLKKKISSGDKIPFTRIGNSVMLFNHKISPQVRDDEYRDIIKALTDWNFELSKTRIYYMYAISRMYETFWN